MYIGVLILLFFLCVSAQQQQEVLQYKPQIPFSKEWLHLLEYFYNTRGHNRTKEQKCLHKIPRFYCLPFLWDDAIIDRDAYHLRPQDIKSITALGDSITAGFGMISGRPPFSTVLEYRGKTFPIGGDTDEYTLSNFLSTYNPYITGASGGVTLPLAKGKEMNNAVSGAKSQDLDEQITRLVKLYRTHYKAYKDEWKLITVFVGANNVCVLCNPPSTRLPGLADADVFESNIRHVLDRVKDEIGKSFVNLVGLFNVSAVYEASRGDPYCEYIFDPSHITVCSCIQDDKEQRKAADLLIIEYNTRLKKLELEYKHKHKEFGLSYQPGFTQFEIAKYKQSYLSDVDCFHPNKCANQVMAILLWNNMFSNAVEKESKLNVESIDFVCPSPRRPYIQ
ncbi:hypothetical protein BDB01DRAFT_806093 [Pilobolus umbonatus]|nr:hypothetical protein BDB01DRAFT_806093 [Pilobolus umbonatus]